MALSSPKHRLTQSGRGWYKKVNRKPKWICSLTIAPTPEAADDYYEKNFSALWQPAPVATAAVKVKDLSNHFLERKSRAGISQRAYDEYERALTDFADVVGDETRVDELAPLHFAGVRLAWSKRFGPDRLKKFIGTVRSMFNWARRPPFRLPEPDYGDEFDPPRKVDFRLNRKEHRERNGVKLFTPAEVGKLLAKSDRAMRAMILLALNGGFGNTDVSALPRSVVDLEGGWIDYARSKTGTDRRVPLWPETIKALRDVFNYHPKSRVRPEVFASPALVFLTRKGRPYIEQTRGRQSGKLLHKDDVSTRFNVFCAACGLSRQGRGFYSLRRTFRTLADEHGDQRAAARVMGHEVGDVGGIYVLHVSDARLRALTDSVRLRLFGSQSGPARPAASKLPGGGSRAKSRPPRRGESR